MEKLRNTCLFLSIALFTMLAVPRISEMTIHMAEIVNMGFVFWILIMLGIGVGAIVLGYKERMGRKGLEMDF